MSEWVLDASALLSLLNQETGADEVRRCLPRALIGSVNLVEVLTRLVDGGIDARAAAERLAWLRLRVVDFDRHQAVIAAELREPTRLYGLSLGDRACLALALARGLPVLTADRAWRDLDLGIEIIVIR